MVRVKGRLKEKSLNHQDVLQRGQVVPSTIRARTRRFRQELIAGDFGVDHPALDCPRNNIGTLPIHRRARTILIEGIDSQRPVGIVGPFQRTAHLRA